MVLFCNELNRIDKVWMYEEIMTNDDNLESNLLTFSLLKRRLVYVLVELCCLLLSSSEELCTVNLPLQINYAAGRLVTVIVYCFS